MLVENYENVGNLVLANPPKPPTILHPGTLSEFIGTNEIAVMDFFYDSKKLDTQDWAYQYGIKSLVWCLFVDTLGITIDTSIEGYVWLATWP